MAETQYNLIEGLVAFPFPSSAIKPLPHYTDTISDILYYLDIKSLLSLVYT